MLQVFTEIKGKNNPTSLTNDSGSRKWEGKRGQEPHTVCFVNTVKHIQCTGVLWCNNTHHVKRSLMSISHYWPLTTGITRTEGYGRLSWKWQDAYGADIFAVSPKEVKGRGFYGLCHSLPTCPQAVSGALHVPVEQSLCTAEHAVL